MLKMGWRQVSKDEKKREKKEKKKNIFEIK